MAEFIHNERRLGGQELLNDDIKIQKPDYYGL
jgi:hypothetical protein